MKQSVLFLLFMILIPICTKTQTLSQAEKEELINSLYITNIDSMFTLHYAPNAIQSIIDYIVDDSSDFQEAIPAIIENIWKVSPFDQTEFLWALYLLNAPETEQYVLAFIDSVDHYSDTIFTKLTLKLLANDILFKLGNYSKYELVFDELSQEKPKISSYLISMLSAIVRNIPTEEIKAKNALITIASEDSEAIYRYYAISDLIDKYGNEMIPFFCERFLQDTDLSILVLLYRNLSLYKDDLIKSSFKTKVKFFPETFTRYQILSELIFKYGSVSDYKFVSDYLKSGIDPENQNMISDMLSVYTPIIPDDSLTAIEYLVNLLDTVYNYTWLGDLTFSNELKNILTTAKTNLQNGDSLACRVQVQAFQDLVDNVYKDSLNTDPRFVTIEGWKFLYWNAQYILDRLPEPLVVVPLSLDVINPAMSLVNPGSFTMEVKGTGFSANSVVYFNGNARTTTYVADTLLTAQILASDVSVAGNYPVWVTEGTTNSDTLTYRVVSTLPQPVRPVLECVRNNGDGTYTAFFGYRNDNDVSVYIPIGNRNKFTPNPQDRGQTRVFQPGRKVKVFTIDFNGSNLVWTLNGRTSTASSNSAPCQ